MYSRCTEMHSGYNLSPYHRHANEVYYLIYLFFVFFVLEIFGHTDWLNEHLKNKCQTSFNCNCCYLFHYDYFICQQMKPVLL